MQQITFNFVMKLLVLLMLIQNIVFCSLYLITFPTTSIFYIILINSLIATTWYLLKGIK